MMSTVGDDMEKKSLASEYPDIATEWHPTKNGDLLPEDVAPKSGKKFGGLENAAMNGRQKCMQEQMDTDAHIAQIIRFFQIITT